jgi:hypothetical protein
MAQVVLSPIQTQQVETAYQLGKQALEAGRSNAPAQDADMMALIAGNKVGESLPALRSFCKGWQDAQQTRANAEVAELLAKWAAEAE